jgi:hypothetical protein
LSETEADNNKLEVTEGMGESSVVDTTGSAFSAVRANIKRRSDKWAFDSSAPHHMTANEQYFATQKRISAPVNISLTDKGTILVYESDPVNIEMLVQGK